MEDLTDRYLGAYRVIAAIGRGGTASVYKAHQVAMDRYVALKVLPRHRAFEPQFLTRFRQEAYVLAQLQHPRILQVYDFGERDGYAFLVMPLITGGTLAQALRRRRMSLAITLRIVGQVCDALDYAHSKNVVHRDIKPANLLLDERQNCVVADFGLARILEDATKVTSTGVVMGTAAYMSPEQAAGAKVGPLSDIYSLGIVLYEMVTGRVPFTGHNEAAVRMAHLMADVPPPRIFNPTLPGDLESAVLKALARDPKDRFPSARELHVALLSAVRDVPHSAMSSMLPDHREHESADLGSVFPTIDSGAFLADVGGAAPWTIRGATRRKGRTRTVVAAVAMGGALLPGAVLGIWFQTGGTTSPAPRASMASQRPAAAIEPAAESPTSTPAAERVVEPPPRAIEDAPADAARENVLAPESATAVPAGRNGAVTANVGPPSVAAPEPLREPVAPIESQPARLIVESLPRSQIYIDGLLRGETDVDGRFVLEIPVPGAHVVRVSHPGKRDFERAIMTVHNEPTLLQPVLEDAGGSLQVRTSAGAEVLVDNASRGVTDSNGVLFVRDIFPGRHDVRVLLVDKKEFRQIATVEAGRESILDAPLENLAPSASAWPVPGSTISAGKRILMFHFVEGTWHFGILTTSRGRITWTETETAGYVIGQIGGFLNPQSIERGLSMDNFAADCHEVVDVGRNRIVGGGEHIRLRTRNYNFAQAVENAERRLVPKGNSPIPGLQRAIREACDGILPIASRGQRSRKNASVNVSGSEGGA